MNNEVEREAVAPARPKSRSTAIKEAREALRESGYRCLQHHTLREGAAKVGEFWMYGNGYELVIVTGTWDAREGDFDSWDVFVPIAASNMVAHTMAAIRARAPKDMGS